MFYFIVDKHRVWKKWNWKRVSPSSRFSVSISIFLRISTGLRFVHCDGFFLKFCCHDSSKTIYFSRTILYCGSWLTHHRLSSTSDRRPQQHRIVGCRMCCWSSMSPLYTHPHTPWLIQHAYYLLLWFFGCHRCCHDNYPSKVTFKPVAVPCVDAGVP